VSLVGACTFEGIVLRSLKYAVRRHKCTSPVKLGHKLCLFNGRGFIKNTNHISDIRAKRLLCDSFLDRDTPRSRSRSRSRGLSKFTKRLFFIPQARVLSLVHTFVDTNSLKKISGLPNTTSLRDISGFNDPYKGIIFITFRTLVRHH